MEVTEAVEENIDNLSIEELEALAADYDIMSNKFTAYEQAVKLSLNSIYGAFGNKWFHFFDINIAESITLQGQNAIIYSETVLNKYFNDFWHKDTKLHEELGIKVKGKLHRPSVIYIDTDSNYVQFGEMYDSVEWLDESKKMDVTTFTLEVYNRRIKEFISFREDGSPKLVEQTDEFYDQQNMYLSGPSVRHDEHIFCFIYKFRQRFGVIVEDIMKKEKYSNKNISLLVDSWKTNGMYLSDLNCCADECIC